MTQDLIMLAVILAAVVASSFLASLIPGRPIPEVVFFVVAGAVLGPHCAGVIHASAGMSLVSRLGMGLLFLIAGYDLDLRELMGRAGRHGAVCWAICMALAVVAVLVLFAAVCVLVALQAERARAWGSRLWKWVVDNAETSSQATLRVTVLLLVTLLALAAALDLDAVLAAFAAGFILRHLLPDERGKRLLDKIEILANGFFVPAFFVISATSIDFAAVGAAPGLLAIFVGLLLLVRALPVAVCLRVFPETRDMPTGEKVSASLYCTMALPLIVALTEAATAVDAMPESMASVLVTAGALTVLVIPVLTNASRVAIAAHPVEAAHEIAEHPDSVREIIHEHHEHVREATELFHEERAELRRRGVRLSAADYLAQAEQIRERHIDDLHRINEHSREEYESLREDRRHAK